MPGPGVSCSERRSTPDRLSAPVRLSPIRRFSSSERVSMPDRLSSPARRPIPDRLSSLSIVASPPVAETHTESHNLTHSARFGPGGRRAQAAAVGGFVEIKEAAPRVARPGSALHAPSAKLPNILAI